MNQSKKLSLFLGLGCKPIKIVIGYHPEWEKDITNKLIGNEPKALDKWGDDVWGDDIYIEAIPERVSFLKASANFLSLNLQDTLWKQDEANMTWWEHIEWSYHGRN